MCVVSSNGARRAEMIPAGPTLHPSPPHDDGSLLLQDGPSRSRSRANWFKKAADGKRSVAHGASHGFGQSLFSTALLGAKHSVRCSSVPPLCGYLSNTIRNPRLAPWATDLSPLRGLGSSSNRLDGQVEVNISNKGSRIQYIASQRHMRFPLIPLACYTLKLNDHSFRKSCCR